MAMETGKVVSHSHWPRDAERLLQLAVQRKCDGVVELAKVTPAHLERLEGGRIV